MNTLKISFSAWILFSLASSFQATAHPYSWSDFPPGKNRPKAKTSAFPCQLLLVLDARAEAESRVEQILYEYPRAGKIEAVHLLPGDRWLVVKVRTSKDQQKAENSASDFEIWQIDDEPAAHSSTQEWHLSNAYIGTLPGDDTLVPELPLAFSNHGSFMADLRSANSIELLKLDSTSSVTPISESIELVLPEESPENPITALAMMAQSAGLLVGRQDGLIYSFPDPFSTSAHTLLEGRHEAMVNMILTSSQPDGPIVSLSSGVKGHVILHHGSQATFLVAPELSTPENVTISQKTGQIAVAYFDGIALFSADGKLIKQRKVSEVSLKRTGVDPQLFWHSGAFRFLKNDRDLLLLSKEQPSGLLWNTPNDILAGVTYRPN